MKNPYFKLLYYSWGIMEKHLLPSYISLSLSLSHVRMHTHIHTHTHTHTHTHKHTHILQTELLPIQHISFLISSPYGNSAEQVVVQLLGYVHSILNLNKCFSSEKWLLTSSKFQILRLSYACKI